MPNDEPFLCGGKDAAKPRIQTHLRLACQVELLTNQVPVTYVCRYLEAWLLSVLDFHRKVDDDLSGLAMLYPGAKEIRLCFLLFANIRIEANGLIA